MHGWNALLTGASYGIGPHIARALGRHRVNVALAARSAEPLNDVATELTGMGVRTVAIPTDLTDPAARQRLVSRAQREVGDIDLLINNAGVLLAGRFQTYEPERIEQIMELNLNVPIQLTRSLLPGMLARGRGHVLQLASLAGKMALPYASLYAASKHGLVGFTHALHTELRGTGVHASVVCPGFIADEGLWARADHRVHPLFGLSKPERVARAVMKAVRRKKLEVLVNPLPVRHVIAAWALAPRLAGKMFRMTGVLSFLRGFGLRAEHDYVPVVRD